MEQRDGVLVAVKTAADPDDPDAIARLHHESRFLALARRPGVVQLVGLDDDGGRPELVTRAVGGGSLATAPPTHPERVIAVVAAVASIVAGLHDLGIVHAALDPSHVLLDDEGRPVLCGFGSAGLVGDPLPQRRPAAAGPPPALRPSRDVYALGRLLEHLTAGTTPPIAAGRRRAHPNASRRSVAALVAQATAPDPTCRPSAAAFADLVHELAPAATLGEVRRPARSGAGTPSDTAAGSATSWPQRPSGRRRARPVLDAGEDRTRRPPPARRLARDEHPRADGSPEASNRSTPTPRRRRALVAVVTASVALGAVVLEVGRPAPPDADRAAAVPGAPRPSLPVTAVPPTDPAPPAPSTTTATPSTPPPLVDPLGCADVRQPVAPAAPAAPCTRSAPPPADGIVVGADRYAVGDPGDEVLVGDWRCDTSLDLAVVRPVTGDVYLFEHLPRAGDPTEIAPVQLAHLGAGAHLEAGPADPSGCPALVGRLADGTATGVFVPDQLVATTDPEQP